MTGSPRFQRKLRRAQAIMALADRLAGAPREYRIRFCGGVYYAEFRDLFRWRKLVEYATWAGEGYACKDRARAIELIEKDKLRIARWAEIPEIEAVA